MSMEYCKKHDRHYDTDQQLNCPLCEEELPEEIDEAAIGAAINASQALLNDILEGLTWFCSEDIQEYSVATAAYERFIKLLDRAKEAKGLDIAMQRALVAQVLSYQGSKFGVWEFKIDMNAKPMPAVYIGNDTVGWYFWCNGAFGGFTKGGEKVGHNVAIAERVDELAEKGEISGQVAHYLRNGSWPCSADNFLMTCGNCKEVFEATLNDTGRYGCTHCGNYRGNVEGVE